MATIDTLIKITALVSGQNAVKGLSDSIKGVSTGGQQMVRSLNQAALAMKAFIASAVVGEFAHFIESQLDVADHLAKVSQSTGIAVEQLAKYKVGADLAGTNIDDFAGAINKLSKNMIDSANPTSQAGAAFRAMGINIHDASGNLKSSDQVIGEISNRFAAFPDGPQKAALAMAVFGKSGATLIPFLNEGSEGMKEFSLNIDQNFAESAEVFNDNLTKMKNNVSNLGIVIAKELLPGMTALTDNFTAQDTGVQTLVIAIKTLESAFVGLSYLASVVTDVIGNVFADMEVRVMSTASAVANAAKLNFSAASAVLKDEAAQLQAIDKASLDRSAQNAADYQKKLSAIWNPQQQAAPSASKKPSLSSSVSNSMMSFGGSNDARLASLQESALRSAEKWIVTQKEAITTLKQQSDYIGMTTIEVQKLKDARTIDAAVAENSINLSKKAKAAFLDQADGIKKARAEILQENYDASRTFEAGAKDYFTKLVEDATDSASQTKQVFGDAFKSMEDVFVNFAQTGKLSFKDMANSIIADIVRIEVQQSIEAPLGRLLGSAVGGSGGFGGLLSGIFGGSSVPDVTAPMPSFAVGTDYVPYDMVAQIHKGERIVPASQNKPGSANAAPVFHITMGGGVSPQEFAQLQQIVQKVDGSIETRSLSAVQQMSKRSTTFLRG